MGYEAVKEGTDICHAVEIVYIAVLPSAKVNVILMHRNLRPVKDSRLM